MSVKLFMQAIIKVALGIVFVALLIFLPAGTLAFWQGWILMALLFVPMLFVGACLMIKSPERLRHRLNAKEQQKEQAFVVKMSGVMFVAGFVVAGLDFRFDWSRLPVPVPIVAVLLFCFAYLLYGEVIRENQYLSRTIEVQEEQKVVTTGLYSLVRHPMYAATVLMFLSVPLILCSLYSFVIFLAYPFLIVKRIKHEEAFLLKKLAGYDAYTEKVKYRLVPFLW